MNSTSAFTNTGDHTLVLTTKNVTIVTQSRRYLVRPKYSINGEIMATKQSNQQRLNDLARTKNARVERFTGYHVHTADGVIIAETLDQAEAILKDLPIAEKTL